MKVCPTKSGVMVHARAQVVMGSRLFVRAIAATFFSTFGSTNGPFLRLRLMRLPYFLRLRTMRRPDVFFGLRVLPPLAILPHGEHGVRPAPMRPSPPPSGW